MSKSLAYRHYQRALAQWPADLLRPELDFQKAMQRRIDRSFTPPTQQPQTPTAAQSPQTQTSSLAPLDEKAELDQVNVLYSFLENRYLKKYPLSPHMLKPLSNPGYYDTLLHELHQAPKRTWFQAMINKWKGYIRWQ